MPRRTAALESVRPILLGIGLPILATCVALLASWRPWRRDAQRGTGSWGGALALGASYGLAHQVVDGRWALPPADVAIWLAYLALAAALAGIMLAYLAPRPRLRRAGVLFVAGLALGLAWVTTKAPREWDWSASQIALGLVLIGLAVLLTWANAEGLAARVRGAAVPLALLAASIGASIALLLAHSAKLAQLAGAIAAALGVASVLALGRPGASLAPGGTVVWTVAVCGLLLSGHFYADLPATAGLLLALAPAGAWLGAAPGLRGWPRWSVALVRLAAVCVLAAAAVWLTFEANASDPADRAD